MLVSIAQHGILLRRNAISWVWVKCLCVLVITSVSPLGSSSFFTIQFILLLRSSANSVVSESKWHKSPHWSLGKQHTSGAFGSLSTSSRTAQLFSSLASNVFCVQKEWDDLWVCSNQRKEAHCFSWSFICLKIEQDLSFCLFLEKMSRLRSRIPLWAYQIRNGTWKVS